MSREVFVWLSLGLLAVAVLANNILAAVAALAPLILATRR